MMASVACMDDTFLVREAQNGNHHAFAELVRQHDRAILRLAMHLTGSESEAQDVYQEAFLRAYTKLGGFRLESCFSTWIYRIATNLSMEHLRKKHRRKEDGFVAVTGEGKRHHVSDTVAAGHSSDADTVLARRELGIRVNSALQRLTPRERVIFELKHYHGLKLRAISGIVRRSEEAVKPSFVRATRKMRAALADMR